VLDELGLRQPTVSRTVPLARSRAAFLRAPPAAEVEDRRADSGRRRRHDEAMRNSELIELVLDRIERTSADERERLRWPTQAMESDPDVQHLARRDPMAFARAVHGIEPELVESEDVLPGRRQTAREVHHISSRIARSSLSEIS